MNELFRLLADSKITLTGEIHDGEIISKFQDASDTAWCTFIITPDDLGISVETFVMLFARPAVLSIKLARQRKKIEKLRIELAEVLADCQPDEDLAVYGRGLVEVTETFDTFFGPVERV